ncbi:MAG: hypothetical protein KJ077_09045 [Anaerolineae bacterium]|nr:hypothetical protein [Anaerolineae bacterium]
MFTQQSLWRKLLRSLATSGSNLLFILVSLAFILTQLVTLQPLTSPPVNPRPSAAKLAAPLLQDSSTKIYLPFIFHQPAAVAGCNPSKGSGGLAPGIHETTVADLKAVVVVGDGYSPQQPSYLAFYLHGDEGNYRQFRFASNKVTKFAKEHGWIFIAPQSPNNGDSWWTNWQGDHNEAVAKVFKEMFAKYNLCRSSVFGSTLSGGSVFWTANFFPNKGGEYPAYTVLICGGSQPKKADRPKVIELGQNPDIVKRSSFEYVYGSEDFLYDGIQRSMTFYKGAGFEVTKEELPGVDHCVPDFLPRIVTHWTDRAAKLGID